MPSPLQHPVLGQLVPDQWNDELVTFRQFPHMQPFWTAGSDEILGDLSPQHRQYVQDYRNHIAELSPICRNMDVHSALQSLGVYEISIRVDGADISTPQAAAYEYFCTHEEKICRNVTDALLRYYRVARQRLSDWFDDDDDYPDDPTSEMLGKIIRFDGFTIVRCSANGIAPLRLAWDPDWDLEHGLLMAVYKDEVLAIGSDDVDDFLDDPTVSSEYGIWTSEDMTDSERTMLQQFADDFEPAEEM